MATPAETGQTMPQGASADSTCPVVLLSMATPAETGQTKPQGVDTTPAGTGQPMPQGAPADSARPVVVSVANPSGGNDATATGLEEGRDRTEEETPPRSSWKFRIAEKFISKFVCSSFMTIIVALYFSQQIKWFNTNDDECAHVGEMPVGNSTASELAAASLWRDQFYDCVAAIAGPMEQLLSDIHFCTDRPAAIFIWFNPLCVLCFCLFYSYVIQPLVLAALSKRLGPFTIKEFEVDKDSWTNSFEKDLFKFRYLQCLKAVCAWGFGLSFGGANKVIFFLLMSAMCSMTLEAIVTPFIMVVTYAVQNDMILYKDPTPTFGDSDRIRLKQSFIIIISCMTLMMCINTMANWETEYCTWVDISPQPGMETMPKMTGDDECRAIIARKCFMTPDLALPKIPSSIAVSASFDVVFAAFGACFSACFAKCRGTPGGGVAPLPAGSGD